jgi:hypothetical protein
MNRLTIRFAARPNDIVMIAVGLLLHFMAFEVDIENSQQRYIHLSH